MSLDAIKARAAVVAGKPDNCEPTEKEFDALIDGAVHDVPTLVAAVEAVLELHQRNMYDECIECLSTDEYGEATNVDYPCPTVTAIQSALGEGE
mgnify:FL=1